MNLRTMLALILAASLPSVGQGAKSPFQAAAEAKRAEISRQARWNATQESAKEAYEMEVASAVEIPRETPRYAETRSRNGLRRVGMIITPWRPWTIPYLADTSTNLLLVSVSPTVAVFTPKTGDRFFALRSSLSEEDQREISSRIEMARAKASAQNNPILSGSPKQGETGALEFGRAYISQIIGNAEALASYQFRTASGVGNRDVLLRGIDVSGLADETPIELPGIYTISGTYRFQAVNGASRTVLVLSPATNTPPAQR